MQNAGDVVEDVTDQAGLRVDTLRQQLYQVARPTAIVVKGHSKSAVAHTLLHERFHLFQNKLESGVAGHDLTKQFRSSPLVLVGATILPVALGCR